MNYFTLIISFLLITLCFIKRNSKILHYSLFIWMWLLFSFNYNNADYPMYSGIYNGTLVGQDVEIGFKLICLFFKNVGFHYTQFLMIYSFIGLYLISKTICTYSKNVSLVSACYFIFPFIFDVIQIRNFMAFAIVIYSLKYLINENKKIINIVKYILLILFATSFHRFSIIALFFIILKIYNINYIKILIIEIAISIVVKTKFFIYLLLKFFNYNKINVYFISGDFSPGKKTVIAIFIITLLTILLCNIIKKHYDDSENEYKKYLDITSKIFMFTLLLLPFYQYNSVLTRFPRSMLLLLYIINSNCSISTCKNKFNDLMVQKNAFLRYSLLVLIIFLWYYYFIIDINNTQKTIHAIFSNNYIFDFFKI